MARISIILFLVTHLTGTVMCFAQLADSIPPAAVALPEAADSGRVYFFTHRSMDTSMTPHAKHIDTMIQSVRYYDPAKERHPFIANPGNIGLAHRSMWFAPRIATGFYHGYSAFDGYLYTHDNIRHYASIAPYTELKYATGSRKEQFFHVIHSHTIKKQLTIAADFRIVNSHGRPYWRQKADDVNSYFTALFTTKNQRYGAAAHYFHNRLKCQENGGLLHDEAYEEFRAGRNATQFEYGLKNAQNTIKENAWLLKQFLDLDFRKPDSAGILQKGLNLGRLTLTTTWDKPRFIYTDMDAASGYYPVIYADSAGAADSIVIKQFSNTLWWTNSPLNAQGKQRKLQLFAALKHSYIEVHQGLQKNFLSQFTPSAGLSFQPLPRWNVSSSYELVFGSHNQGDFLGMLSMQVHPFKDQTKGSFSLQGRYAASETPWAAQHFISNYFIWTNGFFKQKTLNLNLCFHYPLLETGLQWFRISNYVYWNEYAYPTQLWGRTVQVAALYVKKDFTIGAFRVDNKAVLQWSSAKEIQLPVFAATQSYYFSFDLFKKALRMQTGIDASYNTSYYADAWMPATRQFFLQKNKKIGNYVYLDVFMNFRIKRAKLFLALDHFNSGLFGYKYYLIPHYPAADRALRFGVSWIFHD
jgi:hypothetical protein